MSINPPLLFLKDKRDCCCKTFIRLLLFQYKPGIQESTPQNHHGFASGLFELHLNAGELLVDNLNHPFDFLRRDRPGTTLLPQQVHHMGGEFVTSLKQTETERSTLLSFSCLQCIKTYRIRDNFSGKI